MERPLRLLLLLTLLAGARAAHADEATYAGETEAEGMSQPFLVVAGATTTAFSTSSSTTTTNAATASSTSSSTSAAATASSTSNTAATASSTSSSTATATASSTSSSTTATASSTSSSTATNAKKWGASGDAFVVAGATATEASTETTGGTNVNLGTPITTTAGAGPTTTTCGGPEEPARMSTSTGTASTTDGKDSNVPAVVLDLAAKEVALFCRRRRGLHPGAPCCEKVVSYVDVAGICNVSRQPHLILGRLSPSRLLALYAACGGQRAVAACQGSSLPADPVIAQSTPAALGLDISFASTATCDTIQLADQLFANCNMSRETQTQSCCRAIVKTVDQGCLCPLEDYAQFVSYLSVSFVWSNYRACGGRRRRVPDDMSHCYSPASPPPPPASSPPPPASPPPSRHRHPSGPAMAGIIIGAIVAALLLIAGAVALGLYLWKKQAAGRNVNDAELQERQGAGRVQEDQDNQIRVEAFLNRRREQEVANRR